MHTEENLIWDEVSKRAYELMSTTDESLFITGRAGTGKSTLLNYFRSRGSKKHIVLAPTGLAALQVGGSTIHSFFGFPLRHLVDDDPEIRPWSKQHPRLKVLWEAETIIIDEISMVRSDLLDGIDQSMRLNLRSDLPFGGKQMIFIGDVFQLPPVTSEKEINHFEEDNYYSPYFFTSRAYKDCSPKLVELTTIHRQHDEDFIFLLNRVRSGIADQHDLELINTRTAVDPPDDFAITLTSTNAIADHVNNQKLAEIIASPHRYTATIEGDFPERIFPTAQVLELKVGAQVMMIKNDPWGRWVNGSLGKIQSIDGNEVWVVFPNKKSYRVDRITWENKTYTWDKVNHQISFTIQGLFTQYPFRLAWAITIHKSQGLTFDQVVIDTGKGAFAHGQLYVALSRSRSLDGIFLHNMIKPSDLIVDDEVKRFARQFRLG